MLVGWFSVGVKRAATGFENTLKRLLMKGHVRRKRRKDIRS